MHYELRIMNYFKKHRLSVTPLTEMENLDLLDYAYSQLEDCSIPLNPEERSLMLRTMVDSVIAMRKRSQPPTLLVIAPRANATTSASRASANASPLVDPWTRGLVDSSSAGAEARAAVIDIYR